PGRTPVRVALGATAGMDLGQACGRWARTLRRRGWLLTADWSTTQARRWASVPIRPLAELLHQQLLRGPPAEDWPMRANRQLRSCRGQAGTPPRRRTATTPWPV